MEFTKELTSPTRLRLTNAQANFTGAALPGLSFLPTFTLIHSFPWWLILSAQPPEGLLLRLLFLFSHIMVYGVALNFDWLSQKDAPRVLALWPHRKGRFFSSEEAMRKLCRLCRKICYCTGKKPTKEGESNAQTRLNLVAGLPWCFHDPL